MASEEQKERTPSLRLKKKLKLSKQLLLLLQKSEINLNLLSKPETKKKAHYLFFNHQTL